MEKMRYLKIHVALLENNAIRCILNKKSHLLLYIYIPKCQPFSSYKDLKSLPTFRNFHFAMLFFITTKLHNQK